MTRIAKSIVLTVGFALLPTIQAYGQATNTFAKLSTEFQAAERKFFAPIIAAKTDAERQKINLDYKKHPAKQFLSKFKALAIARKGTEDAASALGWIINYASYSEDKRAAGSALRTLVTEHSDSPALVRIASMLQYAGGDGLSEAEVENALVTLKDKSKSTDVRAASMMSLAAIYERQRPGKPSRSAEARDLYLEIQKRFPDSKYAKTAAASIFEVERLQVGMVAPDFEATDENGVSYKLSDYRGKVVVLDFWGFW